MCMWGDQLRQLNGVYDQNNHQQQHQHRKFHISTSLVRLKIQIHQCVCMSVYVHVGEICVCVKNNATRLAPRRNGTKALGSGSWLCLLALALSSGSWPLHPSEATMRRRAGAQWGEGYMAKTFSALAPLPPFFGTRPLHPSDATMRCEGWRLMGRSCGWKIHLDPSLGSSPLPPYPNQHQSTTNSRDISRVVLKSLGNVMSGVTLHGCLWCWAILYV